MARASARSSGTRNRAAGSRVRAWALRTGAAGLVILGAGAGVWYYLDNHNYDPNAPLPLILAEEGPSRITPPSGSASEQTPTPQLLVYDRLTPARKPHTVIGKIAPEPEQPVELNEYLREHFGISQDDETFCIESAQNMGFKDQKPPRDAHIPLPVGDIAPRSPRVYRVQVADVPTKAQAAAIASQNLPDMGAHKVYINRVDCGAEKGIYYRVQIGDFPAYGPAQRLMETLKSAGLAATVVGF